MEQFTNALQRQSVREEEAGDEDVPGLPEAAEDLADEMAVAALSRTISIREDNPAGESHLNLEPVIVAPLICSLSATGSNTCLV